VDSVPELPDYVSWLNLFIGFMNMLNCAVTFHFTGETYFSCDEMIYIRSTHLWAVENLRMTVKSIIGNQLIGP
jgi:hypothetical protein